jgi:hypothetical protein
MKMSRRIEKTRSLVSPRTPQTCFGFLVNDSDTHIIAVYLQLRDEFDSTPNHIQPVEEATNTSARQARCPIAVLQTANVCGLDSGLSQDRSNRAADERLNRLVELLGIDPRARARTTATSNADVSPDEFAPNLRARQ